MPRNGRLKDRILIERPVTEKNATSGARTTTYKPVARRVARISAFILRESSQNNSDATSADVQIEFRYDQSMSQINNEWRITDRSTGRTYEIENLTPVTSRTVMITAKCKYWSK